MFYELRNLVSIVMIEKENYGFYKNMPEKHDLEMMVTTKTSHLVISITLLMLYKSY